MEKMDFRTIPSPPKTAVLGANLEKQIHTQAKPLAPYARTPIGGSKQKERFYVLALKFNLSRAIGCKCGRLGACLWNGTY